MSSQTTASTIAIGAQHAWLLFITMACFGSFFYWQNLSPYVPSVVGTGVTIYLFCVHCVLGLFALFFVLLNYTLSHRLMAGCLGTLTCGITALFAYTDVGGWWALAGLWHIYQIYWDGAWGLVYWPLTWGLFFYLMAFFRSPGTQRELEKHRFAETRFFRFCPWNWQKAKQFVKALAWRCRIRPAFLLPDAVIHREHQQKQEQKRLDAIKREEQQAADERVRDALERRERIKAQKAERDRRDLERLQAMQAQDISRARSRAEREREQQRQRKKNAYYKKFDIDFPRDRTGAIIEKMDEFLDSARAPVPWVVSAPVLSVVPAPVLSVVSATQSVLAPAPAQAPQTVFIPASFALFPAPQDGGASAPFVPSDVNAWIDDPMDVDEPSDDEPLEMSIDAASSPSVSVSAPAPVASLPSVSAKAPAPTSFTTPQPKPKEQVELPSPVKRTSPFSRVASPPSVPSTLPQTPSKSAHIPSGSSVSGLGSGRTKKERIQNGLLSPSPAPAPTTPAPPTTPAQPAKPTLTWPKTKETPALDSSFSSIDPSPPAFSASVPWFAHAPPVTFAPRFAPRVTPPPSVTKAPAKARTVLTLAQYKAKQVEKAGRVFGGSSSHSTFAPTTPSALATAPPWSAQQQQPSVPQPPPHLSHHVSRPFFTPQPQPQPGTSQQPTAPAPERIAGVTREDIYLRFRSEGENEADSEIMTEDTWAILLRDYYRGQGTQ
ncbi:Uu.00g031260.m01.CDS01 [Anthostomella pinea]|uniref:Uu.00g031260.m01.CDS01 n=1 Tax=Anthostomella pinea TaxID=933095 RepID=A0AAI8V3K7_9PEZI|nr:Uu.00g031260.m01.CDS01 [Anthostomella pinea]